MPRKGWEENEKEFSEGLEVNRGLWKKKFSGGRGREKRRQRLAFKREPDRFGTPKKGGEVLWENFGGAACVPRAEQEALTASPSTKRRGGSPLGKKEARNGNGVINTLTGREKGERQGFDPWGKNLKTEERKRGRGGWGGRE